MHRRGQLSRSGWPAKGEAVVGLVVLVGVALAGWLSYRMFGPLMIFSVSEGFSRPIETGPYPAGFGTWSETLCRACHPEIAQEWETSMHAKAWHDPAFQGYWKLDDRPQVCLNCHTPLRNQQPDLVLGFRNSRKLDPILAPNPDYDEGLRDEGVTCAVCHVQDGVIVGPYEDSIAPHPVRQDKSFLDGGGVCRRCHEVEGKDLGMFYIGPPCGTYAEVQEDPAQGVSVQHPPSVPSPSRGEGPQEFPSPFQPSQPKLLRRSRLTGEGAGGGERLPQGYGCIQCHMPAVERPVALGGPMRTSRRHLWKGGHDPEMVRRAVIIEVEDRSRFDDRGGTIDFELRLSNEGAGHTFPTGDPDRFVTVGFTLRNTLDGRLVKTQTHTLKRWIMWRPLILELRDNRLHRGEKREYRFTAKVPDGAGSTVLEVEVAYHLMTEKARRKIGYPDELPIRHSLYTARVMPGTGSGIPGNRVIPGG